MESFFATLKQELVYHRIYESRKEAKQDIFEYIQVWYNRKRSHSSLGYLSPEEFEHKQAYSIAAWSFLSFYYFGGNPVKEIAYYLEFKDSSHFSKFFKAATSLSPLSYRQKANQLP